MSILLTAYVSTGIVLLGLDVIWLRFAAGLLYRPLLGDILLERFRLAPAILFYLIYVGGIVKFAVLPALASGRWTTALINGAALGLVAYGTYDFTNQATLKVWSPLVTIADLCWGTMLTASAAALAATIARMIVPLDR